MALIDITDDSFPEVYKNPDNDIILIDFWAPWCGPCHQFAPIFEGVAEKYPNVVFGKVNTETEQKLSGYFQIRSIPTLLILRDQIELHQQSGVVGEDDLVQIVEQTINLDMEDVRKKLIESGELEE